MRHVEGMAEGFRFGRDAGVGVEHDDLGAGATLALQVIGDHAGPFVGSGRAAVGRLRHRHDEGVVAAHRRQLVLQQGGLGAGLPGVRRQFGFQLPAAGTKSMPGDSTRWS